MRLTLRRWPRRRRRGKSEARDLDLRRPPGPGEGQDPAAGGGGLGELAQQLRENRLSPGAAMRRLVALALQDRAQPARVQVYDYPASAHWKRTRPLPRPGAPPGGLDGPEAWLFFLVPKSYPRRVHRTVAARELVPIVAAPDTEQPVKLVKDTCWGLIWQDDALVYNERVAKVHGPMPRLELVLEGEERRYVVS